MGLRNMLSAVGPIGAAGDPPAYDTAAEVPLQNFCLGTDAQCREKIADSATRTGGANHGFRV